jgi:hypothetical protein
MIEKCYKYGENKRFYCEKKLNIEHGHCELVHENHMKNATMCMFSIIIIRQFK